MFIAFGNLVIVDYQEKQRKVADEMSKFMMEKQKQAKMKKSVWNLEKKIDELIEAKQMIYNCVETKNSYQGFLEIFLRESLTLFDNVQSFIDRILILVEIR